MINIDILSVIITFLSPKDIIECSYLNNIFRSSINKFNINPLICDNNVLKNNNFLLKYYKLRPCNKNNNYYVYFEHDELDKMDEIIRDHYKKNKAQSNIMMNNLIKNNNYYVNKYNNILQNYNDKPYIYNKIKSANIILFDKQYL